MKRRLEQLKIFVYILGKYLKNRNINNKTNRNKNIVIVFQQIFGDSILFSITLNSYVKLFSRENGYKVTVLCRPSVLQFLKQTIDIPEAIELRSMDFTRLVNDFKYYKECLNWVNLNADTLIVPGTSVSAELLLAASSVNRRIGLVQCKKRTWPPILAQLPSMAYTEIVRPTEELMALQRHKFFMNYLGDGEFKAVMPRLKTINWKLPNGRGYCVIAPGASKKEKCWPLERFVEVVDYICDEYGLEICICGGKEEIFYSEYILTHCKCCEKIHDFTGKTSFDMWSAIVQNASIVIGNDSATLHLAAASGRNAICIAGVYDKGHFFPYDVDVLLSDEKKPVTIMKSMPCEFCRTKGYYCGYGNFKCKKAIKRNRCALCIDEIKTREIIESIDLLLRMEQ